MSTDNSNVWAVTHAREWAKAVDKAGQHSPAEHPGHPRNWCPTCETVAQLTDVADALERVTAERDAEIERLKAENRELRLGNELLGVDKRKAQGIVWELWQHAHRVDAADFLTPGQQDYCRALGDDDE